MNLLILRLACTIRGRNTHISILAIISTFMAVYAAFAYKYTILSAWYFKLGLSMVLGLFVSFDSLISYLKGLLAVILSTAAVGGLTYALALAMGGSANGGRIYADTLLRALLVGALCATFMPRAIRALAKRHLFTNETACLSIIHNGESYTLNAIIDSGSFLQEPISGYPAVIVNTDALKKYAVMPIPVSTITSSALLYGFFPESSAINGERQKLFIVISEEEIKGGDAIIPLFAMPDTPKKAIPRLGTANKAANRHRKGGKANAKHI